MINEYKGTAADAQVLKIEWKGRTEGGDSKRQ
jgi:hypothetical protein